MRAVVKNVGSGPAPTRTLEPRAVRARGGVRARRWGLIGQALWQAIETMRSKLRLQNSSMRNAFLSVPPALAPAATQAACHFLHCRLIEIGSKIRVGWDGARSIRIGTG